MSTTIVALHPNPLPAGGEREKKAPRPASAGRGRGPRSGRVRGAAALGAFVLALWFGAGLARAQDTAAEEAAHRAEMIVHLPHDAAKRLFGRETAPAPGPAEAIGSYERGCLGGAVALPANGPNWQVMRPSRNRAWGHPVLIALLERLAAKLPAEAGWPGLLVGDIAQPRGGPMLTGHGSHQIGLDADIEPSPEPRRARRDLGDQCGRSGRARDRSVGLDLAPRASTQSFRARASGRTNFRQCRDQARAVPRSGHRPRLAVEDTGVVGSQLPFSRAPLVPRR